MRTEYGAAQDGEAESFQLGGVVQAAATDTWWSRRSRPAKAGLFLLLVAVAGFVTHDAAFGATEGTTTALVCELINELVGKCMAFCSLTQRFLSGEMLATAMFALQSTCVAPPKFLVSAPVQHFEDARGRHRSQRTLAQTTRRHTTRKAQATPCTCHTRERCILKHRHSI